MTVVLFYLLPFVSMGLFSADKGLFVEDIAGRMYHPLQYFMAKLTVSLPYNAALAAVLQLIFYGLAGMRSGAGVMAQSTLLSVLIGLVAMQVSTEVLLLAMEVAGLVVLHDANQECSGLGCLL